MTFNGKRQNNKTGYKFTYNKHFADELDESPLQDYTQAVTSLEFSKWKIKSENQDVGNHPSSLMATSHVDGSVKVYKFNNFDELDNKHQDNRPDIVFKDHFYSAN